MPSELASWYALPRPAGGDPRDGAHTVGERVGDRHRVDADVQRPAQRLQRAGHVADHGGVGDGEPADLGPAPVVAGDGRRVDPAAGVGDQLRAGGGELAQVVADRGEQRLGGVLAALAAQAAELVADEVDPLPVPGDLARRARRRRRPSRSPSASALPLAPPAWVTTSVDVGVGVRRVGEQRRGEVLLARPGRCAHQHPPAAEQRRAEQLGELAGAQLAGLVLAGPRASGRRRGPPRPLRRPPARRAAPRRR